MIHKPSLGSLDVPQKIWARSVQPFGRLLDTNGQTDRQAKFIYRFYFGLIFVKQETKNSFLYKDVEFKYLCRNFVKTFYLAKAFYLICVKEY